LQQAARLYYCLTEEGVDTDTALLHATTPFDFQQTKGGKVKRVFIRKDGSEGHYSDSSESQQDDNDNIQQDDVKDQQADDKGQQVDNEGQKNDNGEDNEVSEDTTTIRVQSHVDAELLYHDLHELSRPARDRYLQRLTALELGAVTHFISLRVRNVSCLRQAAKALLDAGDI
jgi:hypothetical protein